MLIEEHLIVYGRIFPSKQPGKISIATLLAIKVCQALDGASFEEEDSEKKTIESVAFRYCIGDECLSGKSC